MSEKDQQGEMVPEIQSAELPTGATLQYVEQGDPSGVPVLLLHGLSDSWRSFEPVLPHLPESIRAFALTQRGHGNSSRPEAGYHCHDFAADVAAFMDTLGLEAAVVVGHSMGGAVAQRFAIDHPERTLGLVLAASFASLAASPVAQGLWDEVVSEMEDPVDPGFVREFQESTLAQPVSQSFMETVVEESLKLPARVWRATVADTLQDDFSGELGRIEALTLLVWGDRDGMVPRGDQDAQTAVIAGSRLVVYEGAAHGVHWEEPDRFASDLVSFIEASRQEKTTGGRK
jgi:pimeloyl-ACP methyl ester carboxylesterase